MLDIRAAVSAFESATTLAALRDELHRIALSLGFSGFYYVDSGSAHDGLPFHLGTVEQQWVEDYIRNKFFYSDPVVVKARQLSKPFDWAWVNSLLTDERQHRLYRKTMDAAREFGFANGLIIPHHYRDNAGHFRSSCVGFFYRNRMQSFRKIFIDHTPTLRLLVIYWSAQVDVIREVPLRRSGSKDKQSVLIHLSGRERDVLIWAGRGKTIGETAIILSLSEAMVALHVRNAIEKMGAVNKTQAVVQALFAGLIDL